MNNEKQSAFLNNAKFYEELQEKLNEVRESLRLSMEALGLNTYVQDPDSGLVYKIVKPTGTFTYYRDIDYKRTAKDGEKGGVVLSKKEAEEAGFSVLKKA